MRAGASYPRRTPEQMAALRWLVIHHTNDGDARPTVLDVARYQTGVGAHLKFPGIAYAVYVGADGRASWCQELETVTWHIGATGDTTRAGVSLKNWESVAVAFAGDNPTPEQVVSLRWVVALLRTTVGPLEVVGHRDLSPGTKCPGLEWPAWRAAVL